MANTEMTNRFHDGRLFELYTKYVNEPESVRDVYGYAVLLVGYVLGMLGMLVYLVGPSGDGSSLALLIREIAIPPAATGLVFALLGIVLMLPVRRRGLVVSVAGAVLGLGAVVGFVVAYPQNWVVGTPDYSPIIITVYTASVALIAGVVVMVPVVTGERSYFAETSETSDREHPSIMVGETTRGALFAVYKRGSEWTWRLIDQSAVAASSTTFLSRLETEDRVEHIRDRVADAGLLEIQHSAFRLYRAGEDRWRWLLMREDGDVAAEGGDSFPDRDAAEDSVNVLKEYGPDADVVAIGDAAFDVTEVRGKWKWHLIDGERRTLAEGPKAYSVRDDAKVSVEEFRERSLDAPDFAIETAAVELFEADDEWRWRLLDASDERIATSESGYATKGDAEDAVYNLIDRLPTAPVLAAEESAYEVYEPEPESWRWRLVSADEETLARDSGSTASEDEATSFARRLKEHATAADVVETTEEEFEIYEDGDGWRWRLVTPDREVRARSTDAYDDRETVESAIGRLGEQVSGADLIEFDTAAFQVYEAAEGGWRWRLIDEDGNVMADSGDGEYDSRDDATAAMSTLQEHATDAERLEIETAAFELFQDDEGWGWRLVDEIGDTIAVCGERDDDRDGARDAMDGLVDHVTDRDARVMENAAFQVYQDGDDAWWWRFVLPNGTIVSECAGAFGTRHEAQDAIDGLREVARTAPVETVGWLAALVYPHDGRWRWRLIDGSREPVAESDLTYGSVDEAEAAIEVLGENAHSTVVFEIRGAAFLLTRGEDGWRWRLVDEDHDVIARGPEPLGSREEGERVVRSVERRAASAELLEYDDLAFELSRDGEAWSWRLLDVDRQVLAAGPEPVEARAEAEEAVAAVKREIETASVLEIETAAFEFHEEDDGWRWRLVDETGSELAASLETYPTRVAARETLNAVKEHAPDAWTSFAE